MTWVDYNRYVIHVMKKKAERLEHTREIAAMIYNVNCTKTSDQRKPYQLYPIWTDRLRKMQSAPVVKKVKDKKEVVKKLMHGKNG